MSGVLRRIGGGGGARLSDDGIAIACNVNMVFALFFSLWVTIYVGTVHIFFVYR